MGVVEVVAGFVADLLLQVLLLFLFLLNLCDDNDSFKYHPFPLFSS